MAENDELQLSFFVFFESFPVHRWLSIDFFDGKTKITLSSNAQKISSNESTSEPYPIVDLYFDI